MAPWNPPLDTPLKQTTVFSLASTVSAVYARVLNWGGVHVTTVAHVRRPLNNCTMVCNVSDIE